MKFFEANDGYIYPVDQIESMRLGDQPRDSKVPHGLITGRVSLKSHGYDDAGLKVDNATIETIQRAGGPCFAALPGYTVLVYHSADAADPEPFVEEIPVVGWRIDEWGRVEPLVFEGEWTGMKGSHGLLEPTGKVADVYGSRFSDRASWEAEQARIAQIERRRREEQAAQKDSAAP